MSGAGALGAWAGGDGRASDRRRALGVSASLRRRDVVLVELGDGHVGPFGDGGLRAQVGDVGRPEVVFGRHQAHFDRGKLVVGVEQVDQAFAGDFVLQLIGVDHALVGLDLLVAHVHALDALLQLHLGQARALQHVALDLGQPVFRGRDVFGAFRHGRAVGAVEGVPVEVEVHRLVVARGGAFEVDAGQRLAPIDLDVLAQAGQFGRLGQVRRVRLQFFERVQIEPVGAVLLRERVGQLLFGHDAPDQGRQPREVRREGGLVVDQVLLDLDFARLGLGVFRLAAGVVFDDDLHVAHDLVVALEVFQVDFDAFARVEGRQVQVGDLKAHLLARLVVLVIGEALFLLVAQILVLDRAEGIQVEAHLHPGVEAPLLLLFLVLVVLRDQRVVEQLEGRVVQAERALGPLLRRSVRRHRLQQLGILRHRLAQDLRQARVVGLFARALRDHADFGHVAHVVGRVGVQRLILGFFPARVAEGQWGGARSQPGGFAWLGGARSAQNLLGARRRPGGACRGGGGGGGALVGLGRAQLRRG